MRELYDKLQPLFKLSDYHSQAENSAYCVVEKDLAVALLTQLRDVHSYRHLVLMTVVDWLEQGQFQLTYILHNYESNTDLGLKVMLDRNEPVMDSIHHLWKQARVYQQELHEMFGCIFPGSPRMEEPMILEGWQDMPPMRRDFDTRAYSDANYDHRPRETHEPESHMQQKLYPED